MRLLRFIFGVGVLIHLAGFGNYLPVLSEYAVYSNQIKTELLISWPAACVASSAEQTATPEPTTNISTFKSSVLPRPFSIRSLTEQALQRNFQRCKFRQNDYSPIYRLILILQKSNIRHVSGEEEPPHFA